MRRFIPIGYVVPVVGLALWCELAAAEVTVVKQLPTAQTNAFYVNQPAPLQPDPLLKLPIGAIEPQGWVREQLVREAAGFVGHLEEISQFLKRDTNAWITPDAEGHSGWEELPYWLKGFGDLGYVLHDERIINDAKWWIEGVLKTQREDGYFGPRSNLTRIDGTPDLWPNMIMLDALQSYYEYTGDQRVIDLMTKYFQWELAVPEEDFLRPYWQNRRGADNLASVHWLYSRTGDAFLLELAEKIHRRTADWKGGVIDWHGVNVCQGFREPGNYYVQSKDPTDLAAAERNYQTVMGIYGQVPGGMFGADEVARPGYVGPRQAAETCSMVEYMLSFESLLKISGDTRWAERCEDVAFNSLPAALTADFKALRYLTAPNHPLTDGRSKSPGIMNGGPMYRMDPHDHRCCQHNVAHGWPYYAEHLWLATRDNGLAVALFAPSTVTAKVSDGTEVTIAEETSYPFAEEIAFHVKPRSAVTFPLYLRWPTWCAQPKVTINGTPETVTGEPGGYICIARKWQAGDTVVLALPMQLAVRTWTKNGDCVSIDRGPLTYSLAIDEEYRRAGGTDEWPAWDILPKSTWNYGLVLDAKNPTAGIEIEQTNAPVPAQPFEPNAVPIRLRVKARQLPAWTLDENGLVHEVQASPAYDTNAVETVTLIPMGAARIRVTAFPTTSDAIDAHEWTKPINAQPAQASHCYEGDTMGALSDGRVPANSNDQSVPRFTWWNHKGTTEWVQYDYETPQQISATSVYWFDDGPDGGCHVPASWRVLYRDGETWQPVTVESAYGTAKDQFNNVTFKPVTTTAVRLEVQLQKDSSGGILEWQVTRVDAQSSAKAGHEYPITPAPFTAVHFTDGFWQPRLETNRTVTLPFAWKKCEETGRIANFAKAGGLMEGEHEGARYNDSDVFKVVEGAAYALELKDDPAAEKYVDDVIAKIAAAQESDGYLYTPRTLLKGEAPEAVGAERWSFLRHSHELYNVGHLYEAAVAYAQATGKTTLLNVALKNAALIDQVFGSDAKHDVPGHQEIEIGLVKLYRLTGQRNLLELAKFFLDERGRADGRELYGEYAQDHLPVVQQTHPVGHSVRAMYLYCGMADVAALTGDASYVSAIDRMWQNMVACRMYVTGGLGARHGGEAFGDDYELPNLQAYAETCAAVGNALWNERMFCMHGDAKYADVLERVLYNGFLSGVSLSGDLFFYTNPLASAGKFNRQPWYDCACCPSNVVRLLPSLPGYVYATRGDQLFVNLYIGSEGEVEVQDQPVKLVQETQYPWNGAVKLRITPAAPLAFELRLRVPGWVRGRPVPSDLYAYENQHAADVTLKVNGETLPVRLEDGYAVVKRQWAAGDVVEFDMAMPIRRVVANSQVASCQGCVALERGPLVYCVEGVDNDGAVDNLVLPDDAKLRTEQRPDLLGGITVITGTAQRIGADGKVSDAAITAVPYHLWNHRGAGQMTVWIPRTADAENPAREPAAASE